MVHSGSDCHRQAASHMFMTYTVSQSLAKSNRYYCFSIQDGLLLGVHNRVTHGTLMGFLDNSKVLSSKSGYIHLDILHLLTEWEGQMGKYLALGHGIQTKHSKVHVP